MVDVQPQQRVLPPHFSINCFPHDSLRFPVFTGPDGLAPNRSHLLVDKHPIGTNPYTSEATHDTEYLWRAPPRISNPVHLRPRSSFAGEIGWHNLALREREKTWSGHHKLTSEFWRVAEDVSTHRYQSAWYPGPGERGDPAREGAYFLRFPNTGQRTRTSLGFSSKSDHDSAGTRYTSSGSCQHPWRRTPAATPITRYDDADVVSVERDQEGSSDQGVDVNNSTLRPGYNPVESRDQENSSSSCSGYKPYRQPKASASNSVNRRIHFKTY